MNFTKKITTFSSIILLFILAGCQSVQVRGQHVTDQAIEQINKNKSTKKEVVDIIGTPTYVPDYTKNTWYYVQRSLTKKAWFNPKVVEQRIVKVTFGNNNKVLSAVILKNTQNENISINSDYTKTLGTEKTGLQKFVNNLGRFHKSTGVTKRNSGKKK